ncbi:MAG TPA: PPC domain-containing DNA-binding protein [Nevskiaceae bacterium]|nr:PPC domain-containing DNA-binding protein [Nevskiaceae bacterium]
MIHTFDGFNYVIRLDKGERLATALEQFFAAAKPEGAWVSGVGGVLEVILGFYDLDKKEYHWQTFKGLREIASLQGNIALDEQGKLMFHLHGVFANEKYQTVGGHVKDLVAGGTVELFVHRTYQPLHRKMDDGVGLPILDL